MSNEYFLGKGTGDLNIKAECMFLTKTYSIKDCLKTYLQSYNNEVIIDYTLPSEFEIEFILNSNNGGNPNYAYIRFNGSSDNLFVGKLGSSSRDVLLYNGSNQIIHQIPVSTDTKYSLTYSNGSATLKSGNDTVTASMTLTKLYSLNATANGVIKNILIKPL